MQSVDYEKLPDLCSHCGNVGHRVTACKHVQPAVSKPVEQPKSDRGRSRKRHTRAEKRRAVSQVYVPKQSKDKVVVIAPTPPPRLDSGEGPSFVQKSPVIMDHVPIHVGMNQVPNREESALVTLGQELHEPIQTSSQPEKGPSPIENVLIVNGKDNYGHMVIGVASPMNHVDNGSIVATDSDGVCDSDDVSISDSPRGISPIVPNSSRFDEAEREEEGQEFTQVLSKAQRKSRR